MYVRMYACFAGYNTWRWFSAKQTITRQLQLFVPKECFTIILINVYLNFGNVLAWHGNACASAVSLNLNQPITQNYKSDSNA
jgi:hypothetical protein